MFKWVLTPLEFKYTKYQNIFRVVISKDTDKKHGYSRDIDILLLRYSEYIALAIHYLKQYIIKLFSLLSFNSFFIRVILLEHGLF